MFSKRDRTGYFEQIACLARRKIHGVHEALVPAEDTYVTRILQRAGANAAAHYAAILELFDLGILEEDASDRRLNVRRSALGIARFTFKDLASGESLEGYSVNLSSRGMCLETPHRIEVGQQLNIQVSLYDSRESAVCSGKVAWIREPLPGFYTLGIAFGA